MTESEEFLQKFGYRSFEGDRKNTLRRILDIIFFEVRSTWDKSRFGKVLLIIVLVINAITLLILVSITGQTDLSEATIRDSINSAIANYLNFTGNPVQSSNEFNFFAIQIQIGFLLVALFGISGSGLFADDKEGRVIEIYLSRIGKMEYVIGKIGSILVYTNLFMMGPLFMITFLNLQSYGVKHFDYIDIYLGLFLYCILASLILGMGILLLSSLVEKRNYASLGYFLIYVLGGIFGSLLYQLDSSNEMLLLVSPEIFLSLLAYVCLGDYNLGLLNFSEFSLQDLILDDGQGLEYWHVWFTALGYILVLGSLLSYKIYRLTTEEL